MKIRTLLLGMALVAMTGAAQADEIDNRLENMGMEQLPSGFEAGEQLVGEVNNTPPAAAKVQMPDAPKGGDCPEGMICDKNGNCFYAATPNYSSGGDNSGGSKSPKKDEGGEPFWKDYTKTNKPNKTKK